MSMTSLITKLSALNLPGMAESLKNLNDSGLIASSTTEEVLTRLIDRESETREQAKAERMLKKAKFRYAASVQTVHVGVDRNLNKATLTRLSDCSWIKRGANLLICGPTGAGKSYIASALGQRACVLGMATLYFNCNKLWPLLRQARSHDRYEREIKKMAKAALLVLDDFGMQKLDAMDRLSLLEILEDRWGKASTIIVSQLPFPKWYEVLGDPTVADAICDRLFSDAEKLELKGESLRKKPAQP